MMSDSDMDNASERVELETEFDRMLAPLRRKVFITIGVLVGTVMPFEVILIFGFLTDSGRFALQTLHGAVVGLGALVIFAVSMLMVLLPTKLMSYKAYQKSCEAANSAKHAAEASGRMEADMKATLAEVRISAKSVPAKLDKIAEAVQSDPIREDLVKR